MPLVHPPIWSRRWERRRLLPRLQRAPWPGARRPRSMGLVATLVSARGFAGYAILEERREHLVNGERNQAALGGCRGSKAPDNSGLAPRACNLLCKASRSAAVPARRCPRSASGRTTIVAFGSA